MELIVSEKSFDLKWLYLHDVLHTMNVTLLQSYLASQLFARYCWLVALQV
jgi:hypothetical protein